MESKFLIESYIFPYPSITLFPHYRCLQSKYIFVVFALCYCWSLFIIALILLSLFILSCVGAVLLQLIIFLVCGHEIYTCSGCRVHIMLMMPAENNSWIKQNKKRENKLKLELWSKNEKKKKTTITTHMLTKCLLVS